jgi:hypothetical protein
MNTCNVFKAATKYGFGAGSIFAAEELRKRIFRVLPFKKEESMTPPEITTALGLDPIPETIGVIERQLETLGRNPLVRVCQRRMGKYHVEYFRDLRVHNQQIAQCVREIEKAGKPPKGKHRLVKLSQRQGEIELLTFPTLYAKGMLRVNREPNEKQEPTKDGKFNVTCSISGMRLTYFGTKRVAKAFVDRIGPGWSKLFADIWASEETDFDGRLYELVARIGRLYSQDDMGQDDGDHSYEIARHEFVEERLPKEWIYPRETREKKQLGCYRGIVFGGPCAVLRDGDGGKYRSFFVMQGIHEGSLQRVWLHFDTFPGEAPRVTEHTKLKQAMYIR